jgi:cell division protein FtsQ
MSSVAPAPRVRTDPRISRRRRAVERSRRRRLFFQCVIVAGLVAALWGALWSPLLHLREIRVKGSVRVTAAAVARVAELSPDDNLLMVSAAEVERATESLAWVERAKVDRMLPGTIRVKVVERRPAAVLQLGARRWLLDDDGRVLGAGTRRGLPIVAGLPLDGVEAGQRLRDRAGRAALRAYRSLPRSFAGRVEALFAPTPERISLSLESGVLVRYGAAERVPAKAKVLVALLRKLGAEGRTPAYIDVRVPQSPAVSQAAAVVGTTPEG